MIANDHETQLLSHVQSLIQHLYSGSATPAEIETIQSQLQDYQRQSPLGWLIADHLIASVDANVRFFAALTFIVKINQSPLGKEDGSLLSKLLSWLVHLIDQGEQQYVLRKVCSALVTLFVQPSTRWQMPVLHLVCCMIAHQAVPESTLDIHVLIEESLPSLSQQHLRALLAFIKILAEDASNVPHNSQYSSCHRRLGENVSDVVVVLRFLFQSPLGQDQVFQKDVLDAYQAWIGYAREAFPSASDQRSDLRGLLQPTTCLLFNENIFEPAAEFFIDLLTNNDDRFLRNDFLDPFAQIFHTEWAQTLLTELESEPSDEALLFGRLALSLGQSLAETLVKGKDGTDWLLDMMHYLTRISNHATIDQGMAGAICDFWDNYTIAVPFVETEDLEEQAVLTSARRHWKQAIDELCHAGALPLNIEGDFLNLGVEHPTTEFRGRIRSSIQASYDDFGVLVLDGLVTTALSAQDDSANFGSLEVALYCLADLATSMDYNTQYKDEETVLLERLFGSPLFHQLTSLDTKVPVRLRKRAISIISDQDTYFKAHPQQLMRALEMLFQTMDFPALAETSAFAVRNLSDAGRAHLTPAIDRLMQSTTHVIRSCEQTSRSKACLITAAASVAQAITQPFEQRRIVDKLLSAILGSVTLQPASQEHTQQSHLLALEQLQAMGKALQEPQQRAIYISDDEEQDISPQESRNLDSCNDAILAAVASLLNPRDDGNLLEAACGVMSVGHKEQPPGYFHFSPSVTADLITTTPLTNSRLEEAVKTAANFLSSRSARLDKHDQAKLRLISFICTIIESLDTPGSDPELSYYCVEFVNRLVPVHVACLAKVPSQYVSSLFHFTLRCLQGQGAMPKKAATQLWNALAGMANAQDESIISHIVADLGHDLTRILVFSFSGDGARSDLDVLARTFRKLHVRQPLTKQWTEAAVTAAEFPSQRASEADKRKFVQQLVISRDDRTTEKVVRDFWTLCRGTPAGYG